MKKKKADKFNSTVITLNKRAYYNYFITEELTAGLSLQGWEVKSLRVRKVNISNSYVIFKNKEAFLFGAEFTPLSIISTHYICNPIRTRKLLLNQHELNSLYGCINHKGYTIIALSLFWNRAWCKIKIGVAKGKKQHDKRSNIKNREWQISKARISRNTRKLAIENDS